MKNNKKMNLIDLMLLAGVGLLIVLFVVFGMADKIGFLGKNDGEIPIAVKYTLEIQNKEPQMTDYIDEGQQVFDYEKMTPIGEVVSVRKKPATVLVEDHNKKTLVLRELSDKVNYHIDISANGSLSDNAVSISGVNMLVGKSMECVVGDAIVSGVVISVEHENIEEYEEEQK